MPAYVGRKAGELTPECCALHSDHSGKGEKDEKVVGAQAPLLRFNEDVETQCEKTYIEECENGHPDGQASSSWADHLRKLPQRIRW